MRNLARTDLPDAPPPFARISDAVEQVEGVRFRALFAALPARYPDGDTALAELWEQAARAWETEMAAALNALGEQFDRWREGDLSTDALDQAVHEYHNGKAREIWKRYNVDDPAVAVAAAVVHGVLEPGSLPAEVQEQIQPWLELARLPHEDG